MNRRRIASLLIGILAALLGMLTATRIRASRCAALGGQWDEVRRSCRVADGAPGESATQLGMAYLLGAALAIFVAFMLWRLYLAATGRGPRPRR